MCRGRLQRFQVLRPGSRARLCHVRTSSHGSDPPSPATCRPSTRGWAPLARQENAANVGISTTSFFSSREPSARTGARSTMIALSWVPRHCGPLRGGIAAASQEATAGIERALMRADESPPLVPFHLPSIRRRRDRALSARPFRLRRTRQQRGGPARRRPFVERPAGRDEQRGGTLRQPRRRRRGERNDGGRQCRCAERGHRRGRTLRRCVVRSVRNMPLSGVPPVHGWGWRVPAAVLRPRGSGDRHVGLLRRGRRLRMQLRQWPDPHQLQPDLPRLLRVATAPREALESLVDLSASVAVDHIVAASECP